MTDIFVPRAAVNAAVKAHLHAITAEITAAQTPTEDWPQGLYPDGLTQQLAQVQQIADCISRQLAPPPEPVEEPEPTP